MVLGLVCALGCGDAVGGAAESGSGLTPSTPQDPDLALGKTCSGHPSADDLVAALPSYIKELVVMWPRAGRRDDDSCASVARMTIVNHQGLLLTLSVVRYAGDAPSPRDYRVVEDAPLRAVLELDPGHPKVRVEMAGAPSTGREMLESTLEFIDLQAIVERVAAD